MVVVKGRKEELNIIFMLHRARKSAAVVSTLGSNAQVYCGCFPEALARRETWGACSCEQTGARLKNAFDRKETTSRCYISQEKTS